MSEALKTEKPKISYVGRKLLIRSLTNPRKVFPLKSLEELAVTLKEHGVLLPLLVRAHPRKKEFYEIVAGERRWRSSELAGITELPVIIRVLSDSEVVEIQVIENLQREDVSAYDEAIGYGQLLGLEGANGEPLYTAVKIAEKIGKSERYVMNRLSVSRVPKSLLKALEAGDIGTRHCEIIGRIPHREDRISAAKKVLDPQGGDGPLTVKQVQEMVNEDYVIKLAASPFDRADAGLLKAAGACVDCKFRSGNDAALADELVDKAAGKKTGIDPQLCLQPACFRAKTEAMWKQLQGDSGVSTLGVSETEKECDWGGLNWNSKYARFSDTPGWEDTGHYDGRKAGTWEKLLKGTAMGAIWAKHPRTGEIMKLVDRKAAKAAVNALCKEKGKESPFAKAKPKISTKKYVKTQAEKDREAFDIEVKKVALDVLSDAFVKADSKKLLLQLFRMSLSDEETSRDAIGQWMGLDMKCDSGSEEADIELIFEKVKSYDLAGLVIMCALLPVAGDMRWSAMGAYRFKEFAELYKVDIKGIEKTAKANVQAAKKLAKKKVPAKKAAKKKVAGKKEGK